MNLVAKTDNALCNLRWRWTKFNSFKFMTMKLLRTLAWYKINLVYYSFFQLKILYMIFCSLFYITYKMPVLQFLVFLYGNWKPVLRRLHFGDQKIMPTSAQGWFKPLFLRWKIEKQLEVQPMGVKELSVALQI